MPTLRKRTTIVEMARTLLQDAGLPNTITPFKTYTGNKPSVAHLQIFGCIEGYVHVLQEKLDKKTLECIHLGYSKHKRAFLLVHRSSGRIVESRDVHFGESELVEPSRVMIETETTQDEADTEKSPVEEGKESNSDS